MRSTNTLLNTPYNKNSRVYESYTQTSRSPANVNRLVRNRPSSEYGNTGTTSPPAVITRKKVVKIKKKVVYDKEKDGAVRINPSFYVYAVLVFFGLMAIILVNAAYVSKKNTVEALRQELKTQKEANTDARVALLSGYDENEALQRAAELGMSKPKPYQIVYINVPKESYSSVHNTITNGPKEESPAVSLIGNLFEFLGFGR